jgi:subtilisin family serine protease
MPVIGRFALILLSVSTIAFGQQAEPMQRALPAADMSSAFPDLRDGFAIVRPAGGPSVGLNTVQAIVALWRDSGTGLAARSVTFETTLGELSDVRVDTDAFGFAVVFLRSSEAGDATVTATSASGNIARVSVSFVSRTSSEATYKSRKRDISLTIYHDRIGILAKSGTAVARIRDIAGNESMEIRQVVAPGIYELDLASDHSLDSLQHLARRLESNYPADIRQAGIVVRTDPTAAPMLLTGKVLVGFEEKLDDDQQDFVKDRFHLATLEPLAPGATVYGAEVKAEYQWDIFGIANELAGLDDPAVRFAHPNFVVRTIDRSGGSPTADVPCSGAWPTPPHTIDPYYCQQWHHDNRGLAGGIVDADIDTPEAWAISTGTAHSPRVAIIDSGFSTTHPDLENKLWHDSDGTPGRSFFDDDHTALLDSEEFPNSHGTSVAGIVGGEAHNTEVGRGVCPGCELLLIRNAAIAEDVWKTFYFAVDQDARVISNSWGVEAVFDSNLDAIELAADSHDIPIVFASESVQTMDRCNDPLDFSSIDEHVIAVSSSTYLDDRTPSGIGNCIDVLAPSRRASYNGIVTTAVKDDPDTDSFYNTQTAIFGGTSAAAPMVSGTIGLMLDVSPSLSRIDIQRVLQDTADKIDPDAGAYHPETGFSRPDSGVGTHAYGRINAFEAVSLVAPFDLAETDPARRARGGMDLILRDHALDWGNTERPSSELFTPTDPRQQTSVTTPQGFLALIGEEPESGKPTKVYVRIRNRGPQPVPDASVNLFWTLAFPLPALPTGFWAQLPAAASSAIDTMGWNSLDFQEIKEVPYSGPSSAGCPRPQDVPKCLPVDETVNDLAQIVVFHLQPPTWDADNSGRLSFLAVVHSEMDPALATLAAAPPHDFNNVMTATVWDNNVALWLADVDEGNSWCPF